MNALQIVGLLDLVLDALETGSLAYLRFQGARDRMQVILDEGRDPTSEEFDTVLVSIQGHSQSIRDS